ncbi:MAG: hypothetical protein RL172_1424 [Bacteroidota bacterium]|jgi:TonB-dependent starch-binding outer membrane protein SusC
MRKRNQLFSGVFLAMLFTLIFTQSFAQSKKITGTVKDDRGVVLPNATVTIKGTKTAVSTNANGVFSITVPANATSLVISYVGMGKKEVAISSGDILDVTLIPSSANLSDVVVVGYGTKRRAEVTSSISSVTERDIKNLPVAGADQALQGKVAGVTVTNNSGQPGAGISVRVRGITSVNGNQPLYVVDGVPILTGTNSTSQDQLGGTPGQNVQSPLATLNPNDIASIDILKDASAQAIYGALGANGVVQITTKRGRAGEGKLAYDVYYGWQGVQKKLKLMNLRQYAEYYNSVVGEKNVNGLDSIGEFKDPSLLGAGTDWQDEIYQTGNIQNHQLSFSGGNGKTTYFMSGNYFDQKGIIIGSGFKRYAARVSVDQQVKSFIKAGMSVNLSRTDQKITLTDGQQSVTDLMLYNSPATPVRALDGTYLSTATIQGVPFGNTQNPVALAMLRNVTAQQTKAFGNIYADIQFLKNFSLRNQLNYDYQVGENVAFQPRIMNEQTGQLVIGPNRYRQDNTTSFYWGFQTYLTYNNTFAGKHNVNVVVGHEAAESKYSSQYATVINTTQNLQSLNAGTIDPSQTGGGKYPWAQESYFGRVNYTFDNRFSIAGSVRRDGSAAFGPGKRYGVFPAVSAGWTVTNEEFTKNWKGISYLKLRAGYGIVGSSQTGANNYTTNIRLASNASGLFGQAGAPGVPANVGNPFLSWESVKTYNAGVDMGFLNGRVDVTVDVYRKITTDMLLSTILPVFAGLDPTPPNNGYQDIEPPVTNAGEMTNQGIDVSITTQNIVKKDFSWKTNIIFSHYKNTLNKLNSEAASIAGYSPTFTPRLVTLTVPGQPVGSFYGFVADGLFRSMDELNSGISYPLPVSQTGTWLGDIRYKDLNNDKAVGDQDVTFIGNPNPTFTFGITNTINVKDFDFSVFLTGSYGADIYNFSRMQTEALFSVYQNQLVTAMDRYTATNTNGNLPRYNQWNTNNLRISSRFIEDGSYMRIQNVSVGYRVPVKWAGRAKMTAARIYFSAQNLYTFTNYSGYDPELGAFNGNITRMNLDYGNYPNPRTFTIGANIEF